MAISLFVLQQMVCIRYPTLGSGKRGQEGPDFADFVMHGLFRKCQPTPYHLYVKVGDQENRRALLVF